MCLAVIEAKRANVLKRIRQEFSLALEESKKNAVMNIKAARHAVAMMEST